MQGKMTKKCVSIHISAKIDLPFRSKNRKNFPDLRDLSDIVTNIV